MTTTNNHPAAAAMYQLQNSNHFISNLAAGVMVRRFKAFRRKIEYVKKVFLACIPVFPISISYPKKSIQHLLEQEDCQGLRIYPAINRRMELTLVLVGIAADGENILQHPVQHDGTALTSTANAKTTPVVDEGQTSPPYPAPKNGF